MSESDSPVPRVSVVIASHRAAFLRGLLPALAHQTMPPADFEVIAVCDYPVDRLQAEFPGVFFHFVKNRSISRKRNDGVRAARAAVVAFIDDDCVPSSDWVAGGLAFLADKPGIAAVEGFTTIENTRYKPPPLREYRRLERPGYRTNNIFYRKQAFLDAGGFDERFTVQREDIDLAFTILGQGLSISHAADIHVMHRVRKNEPWDLLKNCINRRFDPLLFKKHPAAYREHVGSPFPPSLLMLLGFHAATGVLAAAGVPFFIAAVAADIAAVSVLAARRCGRRCAISAVTVEWLSCFAAPLVLLAALIYGSARYRRLLVV